MCGLGPGIALGSTRVYRSLWRDPQTSSLFVLLSPGVRGALMFYGAHVRGLIRNQGLGPKLVGKQTITF